MAPPNENRLLGSGRLFQAPLSLAAAATIYLLSFTIPFLLEHAQEFLREGEGHEGGVLLDAGIWYQRVVTSGFRKPRVHQVSIVTLDRSREGSVVDELCEQRRLLAKLLHRLGQARPKAIVIDKWFLPNDNCDLDDARTRALITAVDEVSSVTSLVIGRYSESERELAQGRSDLLAELKKRGLRQSDQILKPMLSFREDRPESPGVSYGLTRLNFDTRKIPTGWPTYQNLEDVGRQQPQFMNGLAVAAVARSDPSALEQGRFKSILEAGTHPFTGLLSREDFASHLHSATDVLCGSSDPHGEKSWRLCGDDGLSREMLGDLQGRIVVIGQTDPNIDLHDTVVGEMPGVFLQANYIESLLDDRYLRAVGFWPQLLISIVWVGIIESVFRLLRSRPSAALRWSVLLSLLMVLVFYHFVIYFGGYYLVLWPPTVFAVFGRFVQRKLSHTEEE